MEHTVRRLQAHDAMALREFDRQLGPTHDFVELFDLPGADPARANQTDELISVVAVDQSGKVVGYGSLYPGADGAAEPAEVRLLPGQPRSLHRRIHELLDDETARLGLTIRRPREVSWFWRYGWVVVMAAAALSLLVVGIVLGFVGRGDRAGASPVVLVCIGLGCGLTVLTVKVVAVRYGHAHVPSWLGLAVLLGIMLVFGLYVLYQFLQP
jgi:hypothetical protein